MKKYCIYSVDGKVFYSKHNYTVNNWEEDIFKAVIYNSLEEAEIEIKENLPPSLYEIKTIYMKL